MATTTQREGKAEGTSAASHCSLAWTRMTPSNRTREVMEGTTGSHHAVTSTLLTILIILTASLLAVVLWINRITVKDKMQPLLKNLQNHMQYTTIEKQEEEPPEVSV